MILNSHSIGSGVSRILSKILSRFFGRFSLFYPDSSGILQDSSRILGDS